YTSAVELVEDMRRNSGRFALSVPRSKRWRPSRRQAIVAGGITAFSLSLYAGFRRLYKWRLPEAPLVMLTPIRAASNAGSGPAVSANARSLDVQFEKGLAQSAHVRMLSRDQELTAWKSFSPGVAFPEELAARDARHIALRRGAQFVMYGDLYWLGSKWELSL